MTNWPLKQLDRTRLAAESGHFYREHVLTQSFIHYINNIMLHAPGIIPLKIVNVFTAKHIFQRAREVVSK